MRKTLTFNELKDIKTNSYRRVIIFSEIDLGFFVNNSFHNYIDLENMEYIMEQYLICFRNTEKILPYLFIFNEADIPNNEEFFENSNWVIVKEMKIVKEK